ncbi:hypothetical protein AYO44_07395 [Planctomycetaceae bacterium SCGC AG-212-F19]|nr:hypothetical protein AYO44_07395 [Planctomycetaceae bacterium SCGC AG-212-F19]
MLRILGSRKRLCDGLSRRDLLQVGTLGFLGLGDWFRLQPAQAAPASGGVFGQAKACILLFLFGSPSQHDTLDPKPDAPEEVRGELKPIATRVPGMHLSELLPKLARIGDRLTLVRSLSHPYAIHSVAYAITGTPTIDIPMQLNPRDGRHWPFIGSVVDYLDGQRKRGTPEMPRNICLPWLLSSRREGSARDAGPYGHFLGPTYDPLWVEFEGEGTDRPYYYNLNKPNPRNPFAGVKPDCRFPLAGAGALPAGVTLGRLTERQKLLRQFDTTCRAFEQHEASRTFDHHQRRALSLMTTSRTGDALDIAREPLPMREKYGMHLFGQATLAARRLVEAGTRFVTVFWDDFDEAANAWDTHYAHYPNMKNVLCPGLDQTVAALVEDLEDRGMLDETIIACVSEHGRTPRLTMTPKSRGGGRGHWSRAYSALFAGGGFARGKVVGQTDRIGAEVTETLLSPKDILATLYHLLGIDPATTVPDRMGRPMPVAGEGVLRPELLG